MARDSFFSETIYAVSSGAAPSGVAVIRMSGPHVRAVLMRIAGCEPVPRRMSLARLRAADGDVIDRGMVCLFPAPHSFTGEDCAEFHVHGGRAVIGALTAALAAQEGCRGAEAGEFARRAFANGKFDLTEAEALADLIAAETDMQRRLALRNAEGAQYDLYQEWSRDILALRAEIEARLDFSDEEDVSATIEAQVRDGHHDLARRIRDHVAGYRHAEIIREGYQVVIAGRPNSGKSSLLNVLAKREVAIVADSPGTTRDILEVALDLGGRKIVLKDTAGLRETSDRVEGIGIARARQAMAEADLVVYLRSAGEILEPAEDARLLVADGKCDLDSGRQSAAGLAISAVSGAGISELLETIEARAEAAMAAGETVLPSRRRHVDGLVTCLEALERAAGLLDEDLVLAAEELRQADGAIGRIIGSTDVEDLLGAIFGRFCIGK